MGVLGWSGILDKNWSNLVLKSCTELLVIFLTSIGSTLKSIDQLMVKLFSFSDWILWLDLPEVTSCEYGFIEFTSCEYGFSEVPPVSMASVRYLL